jgi:hypothetical protein
MKADGLGPVAVCLSGAESDPDRGPNFRVKMHAVMGSLMALEEA